MKVGGNAALNEFFSKSLLSSNKDAKTKYTSKVAVSYKEKLEQRKVEDAARYVIVSLHRLCIITILHHQRSVSFRNQKKKSESGAIEIFLIGQN